MPSVRNYFGKNYQWWYGHNIKCTDYETVKAKYENTVPLRGHQRKEHNIDVRPVGNRRRKWEAWVKEGDTYGIAFVQAYPQMAKVNGEVVCQGYSYSRQDLLRIYPDNEITIFGAWFSSYTTWEMLGVALPDEIKFVKYGAKCYFMVDQPEGPPMYYYFDKTQITFRPYESNGKRYFKPIAPKQETRYDIDRGAAKAARAELKVFAEYYKLMYPMIAEPSEDRQIRWSEQRKANEFLHLTKWLMRKDGEEYGEHWPEAVSAILRKHTEKRFLYKKEGYEEFLFIPDEHFVADHYRGERLYRLLRPFVSTVVPIGTPFFDNGR